jgi:hypothetical protein
VSPRSLLAPFAMAVLASAAIACGGSEVAAPGADAGSECMPVDPPAACPSSPPSYKNEIEFIVASDCAGAAGGKCHSPGGAESTKDFTTYQGLYSDHLTVAQQVGLCPSSSMGMPPLGSPQPTAAQRLALVTWAGICRAPNN